VSKLKQPAHPATKYDPIGTATVPVMPVPLMLTFPETPVRFNANWSPPTILNPSGAAYVTIRLLPLVLN
jgi:hypothetical protein